MCVSALLFLVSVLQSAIFGQPPAHGPPGPGGKHVVPLLCHLAERSVHSHLRKGPQRIHRRYAWPAGRPAPMCVSAWLIIVSSPHALVPLYDSLLLMSAHAEAPLPLVWFDHGRFHLAFEGESGYSTMHPPSPSPAVLSIVLVTEPQHCSRSPPLPLYVLLTHLEFLDELLSFDFVCVAFSC